MRVCLGLFFVAGMLAGQEAAPVGILSGKVSLLLIRPGISSLDLEIASGNTYQCDFDSQSYIERDHRRITASDLVKGESLEMVTDRKRGRCYARIIRALGDPATVQARLRQPLRMSRNPFIERLSPRGNVTFSAVVLRMNPSTLVVRTRTEPEKIIQLRDDTHFLNSGWPSDLSSLPVNTRVFVRCGKTYDNELEAFQIIWGEIPGPKSRSSF